MPEWLLMLITGGAGASIAAGLMSIWQYKIKRKDTKEDAEDEQTKAIRNLEKRMDEIETKVENLRTYHETDMDAAKQRESKEMQAIKDELCILSYAMMAALSGLQQQGCNGDVTEALSRIKKHLNQQAHGQH